MMRARTAGAVALIAASLAGCGERDGSDAGSDSGGTVADSIAAVSTFRAGSLVIDDVVAPAPVPTGDGIPAVAVYFRVRNDGAGADTLDRIEITGGTATLHQQAGAGGGMETMVPLAFAVLPAGERIRFAPGGRHVMVEGLAQPVEVGDVLPMTMMFRHTGPVAVSARVVAYRDLERVLSGDAAHPDH